MAVSGETFYANNDFNIKNYILDAIEGYYEQALDQTLTAPSPLADSLHIQILVYRVCMILMAG